MFGWLDFFKKSKQVVGLDIGSGSLKLLEILDTPQGFYLNEFKQLPLPHGVIVNGEVIRSEELTNAIKSIFSLSRCRKKGVVTSLSGNSVVIKKINFNLMSDDELRELILDEGSKYLPFDDMEEVYFDFQILKGSDVNPNQIEVVLVAARKDIVDKFTEAVTNAGLSVVIMDVDTFALETMYEENYDVKYEDEDVDFLINIGASITNINAVKGGVSIFTRDFVQGGNIITEALAAKLGVSFEEAELIKVGKVKGATGGDNLQIELLIFAEPILTELERSIDYFRSRSRDNIKHIILSGGTASIYGLAQELERRLGIKTEIVNPFRKIKCNEKVIDQATLAEIGPQAAVGVGLALRRLGDK